MRPLLAHHTTWIHPKVRKISRSWNFRHTGLLRDTWKRDPTIHWGLFHWRQFMNTCVSGWRGKRYLPLCLRNCRSDCYWPCERKHWCSLSHKCIHLRDTRYMIANPWCQKWLRPLWPDSEPLRWWIWCWCRNRLRSVWPTMINIIWIPVLSII